jgi:hypothetical protein
VLSGTTPQTTEWNAEMGPIGGGVGHLSDSGKWPFLKGPMEYLPIGVGSPARSTEKVPKIEAAREVTPVYIDPK